MPDDYGYINARVRAMKSFLLRREEYLTASRQRTEEEFNSFLSTLPSYSNDLRQVLTMQPSKDIYEEALKLNVCRIFRKIIKFCEGEPKELILILLKPWDIYNLKTIIRGILSSQEKSRIIQALIPAGKWDLDFLTHLAEAKDLGSLSNLLVRANADELEREFAQLISNYSLDSPLELLENNLQEAYFRSAQDYLSEGDSNAKIVLEYLSFQIDFLNVFLLLKKIEPGFFKGGKLNEAFLKGLLKAKSTEDVLKLFEHSPYSWLASEGLELYKRTKSLSSLERLFKKTLFSFCSDLYTRGDPLSIGISLAFINFKENEVNNLRLIGKTIRFGMPEDLISQELVYAG